MSSLVAFALLVVLFMLAGLSFAAAWQLATITWWLLAWSPCLIVLAAMAAVIRRSRP